MAYVIGIILLIITLVIIGLVYRKRLYDTVDRLENWKMDIMNRNTASQLAQIKGLNLTGETQDKFETWKNQWESIVTVELPSVEEFLFDIEEAADRYRFSSAKKILHKVELILKAVEDDIENMLQELDELLLSEKESRIHIEELEPKIKAIRLKLLQNRYQYGQAEVRFDVGIDELEEELEIYEDLVASGNYLEAKKLVDTVMVRAEGLIEEVNEFPQLFRTCRNELPSQLDELSAGLRDMKDQGYHIKHLGLEDEIRSYHQRLRDSIQSLENGENKEVKIIIRELEDRIKEIYDVLEKEALARNYVETQIPNYEQTLNDLTATFFETRTEVDILRKAYYFEDSDMEKYLVLDKSITQLKSQLEEITAAMINEGIAHSEVRDHLEHGFGQLTIIEAELDEFKKLIQTLRKDELEAKETLVSMQVSINDIRRKLSQSNIPGVPNYIWDTIESAIERNSRVIKALERQPLDINEVKQVLRDATSAVDNAVEQTDKLLEQAHLTEQVIQYANRYRSRYPILAAKLSESERSFRSFDYDLSLEQAAKAVEEIEPGALRHIEANQKVRS